jgi:deoxyribose-phosphate aldolase
MLIARPPLLFNVISDANPDRPENIALSIDHTLLTPSASRSDIARVCAEALEWKFASVCIHPCWVEFAAAQLAEAPVKVCTVIGFPLGANTTRTKLFEGELALAQGAAELDVVQNVGALKSGEHDYVVSELTALARLTRSAGALLKVILETSLLTAAEKELSCRLATEAGADFVKTSTGFGGGGATVDDVRLMRGAAGASVRVKASGGIRSLDTLRTMLHAGASRIGTSSGVQIMKELPSAGGSLVSVSGSAQYGSAQSGSAEY